MPQKRDISEGVLARFPPTAPPPDTRAKILLLILDHSTKWSNKTHQTFISKLQPHYALQASNPASAETFITSRDPDIILIIGATTMHDSCNRDATATRLRAFARTGGKLIFGGVPYAFNPRSKPHDPAVFKKAFGLDWIVGSTQNTFTKRVPDAAKPLVQLRSGKIRGTFLKNVHEDAAVFAVCENKLGARPKKNAQCPVAYQRYGEGVVAYVGMEDLTADVTVATFLALCKGAWGLGR